MSPSLTSAAQLGVDLVDRTHRQLGTHMRHARFALVARDDVDVQVIDALTGHGTAVDEQVDPAGSEFVDEDVGNLRHHGHDAGQLALVVKGGGDVVTRHDQGVALLGRTHVEEGEADVVAGNLP